ncbi:MAG: ABC transporter substrate-binding protein [Chloroflexi bacterium]|nr:ABC transporter substrate-binding protein [Chloroflexota bacterium]
MPSYKTVFVSLPCALLLLAAACGGAAPTATPTRAPAPAPTAAPAPTPTPTQAPAGQPTPTVRAVVPTLAPTPTSPPRVVGSRGRIVYAKLNELGTNDPHAAPSGGPDNVYQVAVFSGLLTINLDASRAPGLATAFEYSPDGTKLTLTIRKDATFHDGTPVTPADVKFSIERLQSPYATRAPVYALLRDITAVDLSGDKVTLTFKTPNPLFMQTQGSENIQGISVVPKAAVERLGNDGFNAKPIGAGAYKFARRALNDYVELEAHDAYYGPDKPHVKTIRMQIVPEDATRVAMLRTAEADIVEQIPPPVAKQIEKIAGLRALRVPSGIEITMFFHTLAPTIPGTDKPNPLRDARVRQGVFYAIDRQAIIDRILEGEGVFMKGPWSEGATGSDVSIITPYQYNPDKARQLFKEANLPTDVEFPVIYYQASPAVPAVFTAVVDYLNKGGMKAKGQIVEVGTALSMWRGRTAYAMTLIRSGVGGAGGDPALAMRVRILTDGQLSQYNDPTVDKLITGGEPIFDQQKRHEHFKQLWKYAHEQALFVPLYQDVGIHGLGKRVDWKFPPGNPSHLRRVTWREGSP